jgi:shikimate 5-dehydrogenase
MYFIGVTTAQSIINKIFPVWKKTLGHQLELVGIDIPLSGDKEIYRDIVLEMKKSTDIRGALVTTHKIPMYESSKDLFHDLMESSIDFCEIGCIFKRNERLIGEATDVVTVKSAFEEIWQQSKRDSFSSIDACILGCGGAGVALGYALLTSGYKTIRRIILTDMSEDRVVNAKQLLSKYDTDDKLMFYKNYDTNDTDMIVESLLEGSVLINATGMGKDRPGSPISCNVHFPLHSCIWEYNYRGELNFLQYAHAKENDCALQIFDGFRYFLYGWTTVISRVINKEIDSQLFDILAKQATEIVFNR